MPTLLAIRWPSMAFAGDCRQRAVGPRTVRAQQYMYVHVCKAQLAASLFVFLTSMLHRDENAIAVRIHKSMRYARTQSGIAGIAR